MAVVSWDVDGTLYDTAPMKRAVLRAGLRRAPLGPVRLAWLRRYHRAVEATRRHGGQLGNLAARMDRPRLLREEVHWCRTPIARAGPRPGVLAALQKVRARGLVQVAFSDYEADWKIAALGLSEWFDAVVAGESLGWVKPSPRGLFQIAATQEVSVRSILHIGDRPETDGAAARAAGAQSLILGHDFRDYAQLADWVAP